MSPIQNFEQLSRHLVELQSVNNPEHKLRNIVVEILNRLPHSEVLRPFVKDRLKVAMQVPTTAWVGGWGRCQAHGDVTLRSRQIFINYYH
ncbi:hypothetical protein K1719_005070 [Acacia pycnantha]|nr:hypothetical protein K1719_005070 [Acacia pycnantha]